MTLKRKWVPEKSDRFRLYACIYGLAVLAWYAIHTARVSYPGFPLGGPGDFTSFLAAGQIIAKGEANRLYDLGLQSATQRSLLAGYALDAQSLFLPYAYPPFFALLFTPLAHLPLPWAYHLWNSVNLGLLLASVWLVWRQWGSNPRGNFLLASLLALSFVPVIAAFYNGQSSFILLFAMTLALLALKSRRDFLAGAALAMGLVKPQLVLLILAVLVYRRGWRALLGFTVASAVLLLVSIAVVGKEGLEGYVVVLRAGLAWDGMTGMYPALMPNLRGMVYRMGELFTIWSGTKISTPVLSAITVSLTIAVFALTLRAWRAFSSQQSPRFELLAMLTLAGTALVSPHLYPQDLTLLVVGALLVCDASSRYGQGWQLPLAGAGHVVLLVALLLLPGPARAQVAVLLLAAVMIVSYSELRRASGADATTA